jgi:hypothetical protein
MSLKHVARLAAVAATLCAPAPTLATPQISPEKATFAAAIQRSGDTAALRVTYSCRRGDALWVSAKQMASGKKDQRLLGEGSSAIASGWLFSHRNRFTCDGRERTRVFTMDKVEQGAKGTLKPGFARVQFCISTKSDELSLYKAAWVRVA